jgi:hypothetical protein
MHFIQILQDELKYHKHGEKATQNSQLTETVQFSQKRSNFLQLKAHDAKKQTISQHVC